MLNNQMLVGIPIVILYAMFFIRTMKTEADFFLLWELLPWTAKSLILF